MFPIEFDEQQIQQKGTEQDAVLDDL